MHRALFGSHGETKLEEPVLQKTSTATYRGGKGRGATYGLCRMGKFMLLGDTLPVGVSHLCAILGLEMTGAASFMQCMG